MDPEYQNDSQHLIAIGQAQKEMGLFADAVVTLNEAIRLDPGNAETFLQISVVYSELGNWESVLRSGRQYVELRPNEVTGYWAISSALSELGRFDEAIAATQRATTEPRIAA
jgi:tetratricopeptide (TPR) repeat protein